jgi:hypothetical protein
MNAPQCSVTTVTNVNLFEINLNFQFVSNKMVFSQEQKIYIVESYFRNRHLIDGEWQYSIEACFEEFRLQFPDAALTYNIFHHNLTECIQIFRETGSVDRKKGSGRPTTLQTLNMIQEFFDRRVISRNTAIAYPSRSCDLTPCDFFLWPYLKNSIFQHRLNNLDELREAIVTKIDEINNNPQMLANVSTGIVGRVRKCLEVDGAHFDYFGYFLIKVYFFVLVALAC